jgi:hypothetical protein
MSKKISKREQRLKEQIFSLHAQVRNLHEQIIDWKRLCRWRASQVYRIQRIANER